MHSHTWLFTRYPSSGSHARMTNTFIIHPFSQPQLNMLFFYFSLWVPTTEMLSAQWHTEGIHQSMKGTPLNHSGLPGTPSSSNNIYFHSLKLIERWAGMAALYHSTIWTLSIQSGISLLSLDEKETRSFPSIGNLCLLICFLLQKPATPSPISFKISLSIELYVGSRGQKTHQRSFADWLRRKLKTRA